MVASPHIPVLAEELVESIDPASARLVVDGTFGAGGHARLMVAQMPRDSIYHAVDRDPAAREHVPAVRAAAADGVEVRLVHASFAEELERLSGEAVSADVVILDIGVSSMQIDQPTRGFSYARDAPLDMRMDSTAAADAAALVSELDEGSLRRILRRGGAEQEAQLVARAIVRRRAEQPITTTAQLVGIIEDAVPQRMRRQRRGHPAKRVFQALRIAVNDELGQLERALEAGFELLQVGGRLAVISFHSGEDRLVKHRFRELCQRCTCPPEQPVCTCGESPRAEPIGPRQGFTPQPGELERNPRAASARLRVIRRLR